MKKCLFIFIASLTLLSACGAPGEIEVDQAWVRPTAQGENAAVYLTVNNQSDVDEELTGASTTVAEVVEIHESKMENDIMTMTMIPSLLIPAGEEIVFTPGGLHLMLVNIKEELVEGDHIGLILHFKDHEDINIEVHIEDEIPQEDHDH